MVEGQRIMQAASDVFLGWASDGDGRDFYVRQFKDMKGSVEVSSLSPSALREYLELCGWTLARAHAQSGAAREISDYLGNGEQFDEAATAFARNYGDQNIVDHQRLVDAVKAGHIAAVTADVPLVNRLAQRGPMGTVPGDVGRARPFVAGSGPGCAHDSLTLMNPFRAHSRQLVREPPGPMSRPARWSRRLDARGRKHLSNHGHEGRHIGHQ